MKASKTIDFLGRALLAGVFITSGLSKVRNRQGTMQYMKSKNLPENPKLLDAAIAVELGVAPLFAAGVAPRFTAPILASFLMPTSYIFHDFWREQEPQTRQMQQIHFLKNLAILGGLLGFAFRDFEKARGLHVVEESERAIGERPDYLDTAELEEIEDIEQLEGRRLAT